MNGMGADYWREMELANLNSRLIREKLGRDVKVEALVLGSYRSPSQGHFEPSRLNVRLQLPESGLHLTAYSIVAANVDGKILLTSRSNLASALHLEDLINRETRATGIFGGRLAFLENAEDCLGLGLSLGYAEFPKDSGVVYLLDRRAHLVSE